MWLSRRIIPGRLCDDFCLGNLLLVVVVVTGLLLLCLFVVEVETAASAAFTKASSPITLGLVAGGALGEDDACVSNSNSDWVAGKNISPDDLGKGEGGPRSESSGQFDFWSAIFVFVLAKGNGLDRRACGEYFFALFAPASASAGFCPC